MRVLRAVPILLCAGACWIGCGGGGDGGTGAEATAGGLSLAGEMTHKTFDEIKAAIDAGNAADQEYNCAFALGMLENHEQTDADRALSTDLKRVCYGDVHLAMYRRTIDDVRTREDTSQPPFMECVPAQSALANEAKEIDVAGLAEAREQAKELCREAWSE